MGIDIDIDHDQEVLKFHGPSSKISKLVNAYSLASGYTCPGAKDCLSRANRKTGKIKDFGEFRCYAAMLEAAYPSLRKLVWHNTMLMKSIGDDREKIVDLLERSLVMHKPEFISVSRVSCDHISEATSSLRSTLWRSTTSHGSTRICWCIATPSLLTSSMVNRLHQTL